MVRSSRKSISRAQRRARARRPRKSGSSRWFYVALAVIVAMGVTGIVLTRSNNQASANTRPRAANPGANEPGDHWHALLDVNVCGDWIGHAPPFETAAGNPNVRVGIHSHGDGFLHIHPFYRSEAGDNATLGRFLTYGGWKMSDSSLELWEGPPAKSGQTKWSNGDRCPGPDGKAGRVVWQLNCNTRTGNPSDLKPNDQDVISVGFLPPGEKLGLPPGTEKTAAGCRPSAQNNPSDITPNAPASTAPGDTSTTTGTTPGSTDSTPDTTATTQGSTASTTPGSTTP